MPGIHGQQNLKAFIWTTWMIPKTLPETFDFSKFAPNFFQRLEDGPHFLLGVGQFSEAMLYLEECTSLKTLLETKLIHLIQ